MQYTSNPGMCKHETWYHFFWDYQSGGIVQCNQKSFDDGKNLCHYPEQDVKWVILVKTWISEHHAGSNHYVDKRSLCDEEIGFDPGLETLIYSCLISEYSVIYNISVGEKYHLPWLQKFIVTVLYDDSNITKFTSGTIFLKKTGNAGCRLNGTIKKLNVIMSIETKVTQSLLHHWDHKTKSKQYLTPVSCYIAWQSTVTYLLSYVGG